MGKMATILQPGAKEKGRIYQRLCISRSARPIRVLFGIARRRQQHWAHP
jgi:hypothetical protein